MKHGERLQNGMLTIVLGASVLAIAKTFIPTDTLSTQTSTYAFPANVSIPGWRLLQSNPIAAQQTLSPALVSRLDEFTIAGRHYQYLRQDMPISVETRYLMRGYVDVPSILQDSTLTLNQPEFVIRDRAGVGTYVLFYQQGIPHLSTCIASHGETLVHGNEFRRREIYPSVVIKRLLPWVLGQAPLRDTRCLWINISTTAQGAKQGSSASLGEAIAVSQNAAPPELEAALAEWVQKWQNHFPNPD
ncbi:MAG: cyanoexosortase A system-associated protein [Myxacorys californica WJT36-NPBG1]|nr:cyanoexosortase A system-associated protein [Myxacorys californica WJT36-NPBG1]